MPTQFRWFPLAAMAVLVSGCAGNAYLVDAFDETDFRARAKEKTSGNVRVRAAVASPVESETVFGVPLYDDGVQPVWLEIENGSDNDLRFAPVGTDPDYFAPLEVPFKHRGGYTDEARLAMQRRFHELALPRRIPAGSTVSGFVLTHEEPGTKTFNVDLFGSRESHRLTFFVNVPGFVPDYSEVDFNALYGESGFRRLDTDGLRAYLGEIACCSTDAGGTGDGALMNVVLVGSGQDVLRSLIRARWEESPVDFESATPGARDYFWHGRRQDAVFRHQGRRKQDGFHELRLWLAPVTADGELVWIGQIRHFYDHNWTPTRPDPDIDAASWFLIQNLWYSESVRQFGWVRLGDAVPFEAPETDFQGADWFGIKYRSTVWLSKKPRSLADVEVLAWDRIRDAE